jgi:GMP synthase (glutamine-hydrolysing)
MTPTPRRRPAMLDLGVPILGICYGLQFIVHHLGGKVEPAPSANTATPKSIVAETPLHGLPATIDVWMSHGDEAEAPPGFHLTAKTSNALAGIANPKRAHLGRAVPPRGRPHPARAWSCCATSSSTSAAQGRLDPRALHPDHRRAHPRAGRRRPRHLRPLRRRRLLRRRRPRRHRAIGDRLTCIFVNNGVLRKTSSPRSRRPCASKLGLNVVAVDASERFLAKLAGVTDPETKRKIIGNEFIAVFDDEAARSSKSATKPAKTSRGSSRARSTPTSSSPPASKARRRPSRATTTSAACPRT